jgi:DNA-binding transcriptional LysR family regulator
MDQLGALNAFTQRHSAPNGTLRVNAPMAFGTLDVALWLPRFMARYPELKVDLVCNERFVDLIEEGFDVALRLAHELPDSSLMAKRLASSKMLLLASPAYLEEHGTPQVPQDLAKHNCLTYMLVSRPNEWLFSMRDGSVETMTVRGSLQSNTSLALREAALAGVGITATTSFIVHDDVARGDLVPVLSDFMARARELYALYPHKHHLSPKVRAFIDFASEVYQEPRWS